VVLTGDPYQIDNPYIDSSSNGLTYVVDRFKEESIAAILLWSRVNAPTSRSLPRHCSNVRTGGAHGKKEDMSDTGFEKLMVATDGSAFSAAAVREAINIASACSARPVRVTRHQVEH